MKFHIYNIRWEYVELKYWIKMKNNVKRSCSESRDECRGTNVAGICQYFAISPIAAHVSLLSQTSFEITSISQSSSNFRKSKKHARSHLHRVSCRGDEFRKFRGKFQSLLDIRHQEDLGRRDLRGSEIRDWPVFLCSSSRISLPRSRRSPRTGRDSVHSLPFALLGHAATAVRHNKPRRCHLCNARLFFFPCTPGFGRDVAWSARFHSETTRAGPLEGLHNVPISRISSLRDLRGTRPRGIELDFFLARFGAKFEAKFSATGIFFPAFPGTEIAIFFSHRFVLVLIMKCAITRAAITAEKWCISC